jgi:hypothetical protein
VSGDLTDSGPGSPPGARMARGIGSPPGARVAVAAAVTLLVAVAGRPAQAGSFGPFATVGYEYDSNVFMRPSSSPPFAAEGITALGGSLLDYEAGFNSELDWGADRLTLDASATRDQYDRFSFLNHYESLLDGHFHWQLTRVVDGTVTYEQNRYMAPFTDTLTTALLLDTDRLADVAVHVLMTPEWRLDLTPALHQVTTPLPGFADFKLLEKTGVAGLDYLGFGRLTAGLQFTYDSGRYESIAAATNYIQHEFDFTAHYKVGGFSTFSAAAGYTSRDSEANPADSVQPSAGVGVVAGYAGGVGTTSGATGSLSYERQLTGKTSAALTIFRAVNSYIGGANPDIGTGGTVRVTWQADPKFTLGLNYGLTRDQIKGGLILLNVTNRSDRTQTTGFEVRYLALSWLTVRPYVDWNKASSNFALGNYTATIYGVDVTGRLNW